VVSFKDQQFPSFALGEFGIVYKGSLKRSGGGKEVVAVKTLKGKHTPW
jgi:hypothetical protein